MPTFEHDGVELYYEEHGDGPVVLFIHGWAMNHRLWSAQVERFSPTCQVITVDLRGHGDSAAPASGYAYEDHAGDLVALLGLLGGSDVTMVGSSFGGAVALTTASLAPALVTRVLTAGTPPKMVRTGDFPWGIEMSDAEAFIDRLENELASALDQVVLESVYAPPTPEQYRFLHEQVTAMSPKAGVLQHRAVAASDLRPRVTSLRQPLLVLQGTHDNFVRLEAAEWLASNAPDASLTRFEASGHLPNIEEADHFNEVLATFAGLR
jgi:pimeloyl-ACP methyl ester carboxylesterase